MKIKTITWQEPKVGMKIKVEGSFFREDMELFICHIEESLIYYSWNKVATKAECETALTEDVTGIGI